ncbi:unnamed protein product (macronuclear) [Paramecium tetraurelia]|uniref:Cache domain-containing protein n=1 Tax=Paramecium tetraurelia TaxID=5888 RepID=A0DRE3_PARTE|nr:uncharacterized protein GSPATT00019327001 [Paramecium tetraurelia]CAK85610.1 unnamed protein product [Paramecium tetraurelia]|eukprot:XP_001453007.1 hypothetical protein (macronuclear) [Paramecium tetraurelia strain d4-2]
MKNKDQLNSCFRLVQYCLPNLRLRNQFILIVAVFVLLIVTIIALWNLAHQSILNNLFLGESDLLYDTQSKIRLSFMLNKYKSYFYQIFALNGNALISFHRLYLRTKKEVMKGSLEINKNYQMEYEGMIQIPDPLRILNEYGSNISNSFMCYSNTSAYSLPLTEEERIGIKLQEQIQAYGQILYQGSLIMQSNIYSYIDLQKINNLYPCVNRGQGIFTYAPEKRDWYKTLKSTYFNATKYNSYSFKFTAPYLLFTYQTIGLSMTLPIVDENVKFVGGVSSTFLGSKLVQYLSNNETGFQLTYLVSEDGTLIMHPFTVKADQLPLYIYNETFTGFNLTDWYEIKKTDGISSCQQFNLRTTLKCRYNSVTQQEMIVTIENLIEYKMYLIMQQNIEDNKQVVEQQ